MSGTLKIHYETSKKIALSKDFEKIDGLKTQIKSWKLLDTNDFDIFHIGPTGSLQKIRLQQEWTNIYNLASSEKPIEIQIEQRNKKFNKSKDFSQEQPPNDTTDSQFVYVIGSPQNEPEESQVICIKDTNVNTEDHEKSAILHILPNEENPDDTFVECKDDIKSEQNNDKPMKKKQNKSVLDFELDDYENEIVEKKVDDDKIQILIKESQNRINELEKQLKIKSEQSKNLSCENQTVKKILNDEKFKTGQQAQMIEVLEKKIKETEQKGQKKQGSKCKSIHQGTICRSCKISPIQGRRFQCIECDNFNICEECELNLYHSNHLMFRVTEETAKMQDAQKKLLSLKIGEFMKSSNEKSQPTKQETERTKMLKELLERKDHNKIEYFLKKYEDKNDVLFYDEVCKEIGLL